MRVCLLTDEEVDEFNPSEHLQNHEWDYVTVHPPMESFIRELARNSEYDVYLNIYEGLDEEENSGLKCIETLEDLHLAFTGAGSKFYNPTREEMQAVAETNQISFARGFQAESHSNLSYQVEGLSYPLIVKHPNSFASAGLTKDSRVTTFEELQTRFERMSQEYGSARIEEFIEGREFSCLVVENANDLKSPFAYPPAEVQFTEGETFLHEAAKWYSWDIYVVPLSDEILATRIQDVSRRFFLAMDGNGYARVDVRVRPNGEIVILEINPNCGILYDGPDDRSHADLPISWDAAGRDGFLDRIFRAAIKRQAMRAAIKNPAV